MLPDNNSSRTRAAQAICSRVHAERAAGARGPWVLGFSGGPDSLALAAGLALARRYDSDVPPTLLVHVDHCLDAESGARATAAERLADEIGLAFRLIRRDVPAERERGENLEAASRRVRYDALEQVRHTLGGDRILTAHHADDQVETLLLRLRSGSGLLGLAGIQERRGALWRPLLDLRRQELIELVDSLGFEPIRDPANDDRRRDRNRIRHQLLPYLLEKSPDLADALRALMKTVARWRADFTERCTDTFGIECSDAVATIRLETLLGLPPSLALLALQMLESAVDRWPPASTRHRREILRQLRRAHSTNRPQRPPRLDHGWRLRRDGRLELRASSSLRREEIGPFSYTLTVPGSVEIPALDGRMALERRATEAWMFCGAENRAAMRIPAALPTRIEVRNRRPGDRLRPLGAPGIRRLNDLLIDRRVPREERDRIPLLLIDGRIAWVPGIAIADEFRLEGDSEALVAEWVANPGSRP